MLGSTASSMMFKEGTKYLSGVDEAVLKNIEACRDLMNIVRTSMGPNGMNKMVINHLGKLFVTHDSSTILHELEVSHPAAKIIQIAAENQEAEIGDGTCFVLVFAGELVSLSESLLRMGLHVSDIIEGYSKAGKRVLKLLESADEVPCQKLEDIRNEEEVIKGLLAPLSAKQSGYEDMLAKLIAQTCIYVCPKDPTKFSVDNVRVAKVEGSGVGSTRFMKGLVLTRDSMGTVKRVHDAKIAVFNCPLEHASTETTGTVSITSAEQLKEFSVGEEKLLKESMEAVAEAGVNVVVASQTISDLALHFLERHGIFVLRVPSKFDLQRIARVCGARLLARLGAPMAEEMGHCPLVEVREIAGSKLTVFEQSEDCPSKIATIIVRGATQSIMDDIERAIDDGVNTYRALCRDPRLIPGAGATEIELAMKIRRFGEETPGLDQYAIKKFAESLEIIPRTLSENSGMDGTETVTNLYNAHQAGKKDCGVDTEGLTIGDAHVSDAVITKSWGIRLAVDAALSVLRVDQIIMARPAGGPKPPGAR